MADRLRIPALISIALAAGCSGGGNAPANRQPDGGTPAQQTSNTLSEISRAYTAFYAQELRWPNGGADWGARDPLAAPRPFTTADTALFAAPARLPACSSSTRGPCWQGPFLTRGSSLGASPWLDGWNNSIMVALIPTADSGFGLSKQSQGAVVLWSTGPDGIDQTGCTSAGGSPAPCSVNLDLLASGQSTVSGSDDIVVVVGPALDPPTYTGMLLDVLVQSYRSFHADTGGLWPFGDCSWSAAPGVSVEIDGLPYFSGDTVLPVRPDTDGCPSIPAANWLGSYLWSDVASMIDPPMLDGWDHKLMYAYIRPSDGYGGGVTSHPKGSIVLWSTGPDGIDQTGCTSDTCEVSIANLASGLPSGTPSDDIIVVVGTAKD